MADTSATAEVFESEITTIGVVAYACAKVTVQALALVPVVKLPVASLALAFITGEPVPQEEICGVAPVEDAVKWPYWSTSNSFTTPAPKLGEVVAATVNIDPVVEAVVKRRSCVKKLSLI